MRVKESSAKKLLVVNKRFTEDTFLNCVAIKINKHIIGMVVRAGVELFGSDYVMSLILMCVARSKDSSQRRRVRELEVRLSPNCGARIKVEFYPYEKE